MAQGQAIGDAFFTSGASGAVAGTLGPTQCANVPCRYLRIKALAGNSGNFYVGFSSSMTKPAANQSDQTSGLQMAPGDDTGWMPVSNLNLFWVLADNAADSLSFMALS